MNVSYFLEFPRVLVQGYRDYIYFFVLELGELLPPNLQILAHYRLMYCAVKMKFL